MTANENYHSLFDKYKVCILLPTYNNRQSIQAVIEDSLLQTSHVIVVNDGSTDDTLDIVHNLPVQVVSYHKNQGKGYALRKGFAYAYQQGYQYAITIDTDGQHYPDDCEIFLETLQNNEGALMIGARNLHQENVPGKSSFGNRFSNFWFWLETGIKMPDTQSGFRLYPIYLLHDMHFFTRKYEFEIEVIVRSAWNGIPVIPVPIKVFYPEQSERISHFRPLKDFVRISILNSILVFITFLYIKPRDLILRPLQKKGMKKGLKELLFNPTESTYTRAASVGFGVFMGIVPIWCFQLLVGIPLAVLMKMNKTLFIVAANISIFPPIIWAASLATGKLIYRNPNWKIDFRNLQWDQVAQTGKEFFIGGTVLAVIAGLLAFGIVYMLLYLRKRHKQTSTSK
ncbi:MAG: DUF2062 domain-containing protein [Bacteroidetes bacterium]|nr:DUF2062 domain-containing protein [Bacteroidota bacterium]